MIIVYIILGIIYLSFCAERYEAKREKDRQNKEKGLF
jgi:hypothetical protein